MKRSVTGDKWLRNPLLLGSMLFFLAGPFPASALDPARSLFQYNCQTWRRQNGLPANGVNGIAQTKEGYIWLGTSVGLVRFDGIEFNLQDMAGIPQMRSTIVSSLSRSREGGLWFGLEHGAFGFYDGDTISFRGKDERGGMGLNVHSILETANGDLWIASETQSARVTKGNNYTAMMTGTDAKDRFDVTAICEGAKGRIWLGTTRRGLYYWSYEVIKKFPDPALDEANIRSLVEDKEKQIWVGTDKGLFCYDSDFRKKPLPFPWYETRALLMDGHGVVWAGTSGGGLMRFQSVNEPPGQFSKNDGLADDFVSALAEDAEGSIWVGTRNGLSQFSDIKIPTFGKTEGLLADVNLAVAASQKGGFWVATDKGFNHFDGRTATYPTNQMADVYIKTIFEAKNGDLYLVNGSRDLKVFSGGQSVASYTNWTWPNAMTEDDKGVVVGVGGELYRAGTNSYEPYVFANNQKPPLSWVFSMITDADGSIWISCDNGICQVKGDTFKMWTKEQGLPNCKAMWICKDSDGIVWAGLEMGIARLKDGKISNINRDNGLFDNIIYAIVPDDHGYLWVDSSRGIFKVSRQNLNDFADEKINHVECVAYDGLEAVKSDEKIHYMQSGCKTLDGRIWFPTALGVVMINPTNMTANAVPPKVHIQSVRANGTELDRSVRTIVRPGKGELEFHYAGVSYIAPQKIRYRYKLDGYENNWVEAGARRSAFYTNLKPGEYQFNVQACNADGVWSRFGAGYTLELLPHFYQTGWFIFLAGTSVLVVLFGLYAWRVKHLEWKQKRLQQAHDLLDAKVRERTTELAESNASLKNEIEERKRMQAEIQRIHAQLVDASRQAGQAEVASSVLHNVGNVLNSVNVSTSLIGDRLRRMPLANFIKAAKLIEDNIADVGRFLTVDERGRHLPQYLGELARHLNEEQNSVLGEIGGLAENMEHIKGIVAMQQTYARVSGIVETVSLPELVDTALKMHTDAFVRHAVKIVREYEDIPTITVDKHKVLQILVNIMNNAKHACDEGRRTDKQVALRIRLAGEGKVQVEVADNGIGIAPENLTRIFAHGFTTRKNGHGFGLHSAALSAKEMGGALTAHSRGLGYGAMFVLELPLQFSDKKQSRNFADEHVAEVQI